MDKKRNNLFMMICKKHLNVPSLDVEQTDSLFKVMDEAYKAGVKSGIQKNEKKWEKELPQIVKKAHEVANR